MSRQFLNRHEAGIELAHVLEPHKDQAGLLVLGLPRGGVPVAYEVARRLGAELDVLIVRKVGAPGYPELALGAVASGDVVVLNQDVALAYHVTEPALRSEIEVQQAEVVKRERLYRGDRPQLRVQGRPVIVVDDGLATGASMRAAVQALRKLGPEEIIVAVPVAPRHLDPDLVNEADDVVCVEQPEPFYAVGQWYRDFTQTTDDEVVRLMERARPIAARGRVQT